MNRAPDPLVAAIAARAARAVDLTALGADVGGCAACPDLVAARTSVVVGDFPAGARLMLVGEAPGATEDEIGRPFVGKAGRLLDDLLADAGIDRAAVAVGNVLKCRPPANRTPTRPEARRCGGWVDAQVALAGPQVVVTLGATALAWALGAGVRLADVRGRVHPWRDRRLVATYHPSAALRFGPSGVPMAALRADLRLAAEALCLA